MTDSKADVSSSPQHGAARPRTKRVGNRERIVEATIELMNARGNMVGTTQIAEHLGISPGNLYYHFSNMQEIVHEILLRLSEELGQALALDPSEIVDEQHLVGYYSNGAMVLWRYRFMVSSALELTSGNLELERDYRNFTIAGMDWVAMIIRNVVKHHPGPVVASPRDCKNLAENMWVLWNGWPRHAEHYRVDARVSPVAIAHGLEQIALTLAPYVDPGFHTRVKRGLHRFVKNLGPGL
ncbi:MAG: TetR/AcrR family transcriptional regulator [Panacagrimonas sp.]